jgi:hypothetical protein
MSSHKSINKTDIDNLSFEILDYLKSYDSYEFNDIYENDDKAYKDIRNSLESKDGIDMLLESLCKDIKYYSCDNDLSNKEIFRLNQKAFELLIKVNLYSKEVEKEYKKEMGII